MNFDGVDDVVYTTVGQTIGGAVSLGAWFDADTMGIGNIGFLWGHGDRRIELYFNGVAGLNKLRLGTTSPNQWDMTTGFPSLPGWKWAMLTINVVAPSGVVLYTLVENVFSVLTPGSGLTAIGTGPSGGADGHLLLVGRNGPSANGYFDGRLGEAVFYKRVLSEAEARAVACLGVNAVPDHFQYWPLDVGVQNLGSSGAALTNGGATLSATPPIRPAGRRG